MTRDIATMPVRPAAPTAALPSPRRRAGTASPPVLLDAAEQARLAALLARRPGR